jgi:hypothetical protein
MKRLRIIGISLLALFALGAITASAASAVEGVLPLKLKGVTTLGTNAILEDTSGKQIKCAKVTGKGTMSTDVLGEGTLEFKECSSSGLAAYSLDMKETTVVKEAEILAKVTTEICLINSAALTYGISVKLKEPVHILLKALGLLVVVEGAAIGEVSTKKGTLLTAVFVGKKGVQTTAPECKDEKGGVKKHTLTAASDAEHKEKLPASQSVEKGLLQFEEEVELMDT